MPLDSRSLTFKQFHAIMNRIGVHHRFGGLSPEPKPPYIKYVHPTFDMRDGAVFSILFRGMFEDKQFDFRDSEETMYSRIMSWLNSDKQ